MIYGLKELIKFFVLLPIFSFFKIFSINNKRVVFSSFYGKQYSGDPKALFKKLIEISSLYQTVWVYNRKNDLPDDLKDSIVVSRYSLKHLYFLATCKFRIDNCQESHFLKPKKDTVYIQTWHGTPLKKIAQDIKNTSFDRLKKDWLKDSSYWDFCISSSNKISRILSKAFKIEPQKILEVGYPRNDILLNYDVEYANRIKAELNITSDKKIVLYAPTFRDNDIECFQLKLDYDKIKESLADKYILLVRMHSNIKHINPSFFDSAFTFNVSNYNDIQDLYVISDVLITDYSSVFFDFAVLKKPIIFYPYDIDVYREKLRGFYFKYEDIVPGKIVLTEDDLITHLIHLFETNTDLAKLELFNIEFNKINNKSSEDILRTVGLIA
jgi:CDP-glycerol glycerophosphotransferase